MKSWRWAAAGLLLGGAAILSGACGGDDSSGSGGGGGSVSTGSQTTTSSLGPVSVSSTTTMSTSTTMPTTGTQMMMCDAIGPNGVSTMDPTCDGCLGDMCCDQFTACLNDPNCSQCFSPTPPASCDTDTLFAAANDCFDNDCGPACGGGGTEICDTGLSTQDPPCDMCLGDMCCSQFDACLADPDCSLCFSPNAPPECDTDPLLAAANACYVDQCGPACGFFQVCDSDWGAGDQTCATCQGDNCCAEFTACDPNSMCGDCLTSANPDPACDNDADYAATIACINANCMTECM